MNKSVGAAVAIGVTIVWIAAAIGSAVRQDYTALNIITPVMLTVVAWLYITRNGK